MTVRAALALMLAVTLAGCAAPRKEAQRQRIPSDAHVPDFARKPFEPFSRADVVAIAIREWRLWGQPVDDDPPGTRPPLPPELKPEREPGLWQRVGEYWWLGQDANRNESAWTGLHDAFGLEFPANADAQYAWSATFISYVMRIAGAGDRFLYSPSHSDYINAARTGYGAMRAQPPESYAPQLGDLICAGRDKAIGMRYANLPDGHFPAHCAIVVQVIPGMLSVIGGNVDDAVTLTHVPTTPSGTLATPDGRVVDTRYPWFVVIQILYDR